MLKLRASFHQKTSLTEWKYQKDTIKTINTLQSIKDTLQSLFTGGTDICTE